MPPEAVAVLELLGAQGAEVGPLALCCFSKADATGATATVTVGATTAVAAAAAMVAAETGGAASAAGADTGRGGGGGAGGCFRTAVSTVEVAAGAGGAAATAAAAADSWAAARTGSKSPWRRSAAGAWGVGGGAVAAWNRLWAQPWEAKKPGWSSAPTCGGFWA